ncbi:MAG: phage tail sheath family protein, partial [Verrucomicrobia bacterium]|nr:phage tail sheath family protein [Verrucomicrobiota bacterium]
MPATLTFPGVYIEEISSGVRTIVGVATSITAFIGRAARGSVNEPIVINSYADFERNFGGLQRDFLLSYAVRDFYLNGGSQAIVVRLLHPNFANDGVRDSVLTAAKSVASATAGADVATAKMAADAANTTIQNDATKSQAEKDAATAVAAAVVAAAPTAEVAA